MINMKDCDFCGKEVIFIVGENNFFVRIGLVFEGKWVVREGVVVLLVDE